MATAQTETLQSTLKQLSKGRNAHQFVANIRTQVANQEYYKARKFILKMQRTRDERWLNKPLHFVQGIFGLSTSVST